MDFGAEQFGRDRTTATPNSDATLHILHGVKPEPEHAGPYMGLFVKPGSDSAYVIGEAVTFLTGQLENGQSELDPATLIKVNALESILERLNVHERKDQYQPRKKNYTRPPGLFVDSEAKLIFEALRYALVERTPSLEAEHEALIAKRKKAGQTALQFLADYNLPDSPDAPSKREQVDRSLAQHITALNESYQRELSLVTAKDHRVQELLVALDPPLPPAAKIHPEAILPE